MSTSQPQPIPTALVIPIIQGYANGIRPAFAFILISVIFSAMLIPLLIMLFVLSTPKTRRTPIFILNVFAVTLGIIVGGLSNHLTMQSILLPFSGVNATEDFVYNILYIWMPWITEAALLVRVIVVFNLTHRRVLYTVSLLAFPILIKITRAVLIIIFLVQWRRDTLNGGANQFSTTQNLNTWIVKTSWILELFDNGYISFLFLWRLAVQTHLFNGSKIGRVDSGDSAGSFTNRLQRLFWIASTNFIFPLIFGLCQIILIFTGNHILTAASVEMANVYISIISTVFATIWSSTWSFRATLSPALSEGTLPPVTFMMRQMTAALPSQSHDGMADEQVMSKVPGNIWDDNTTAQTRSEL